MTTTLTIGTKLDSYLTWFRAHERLIILLVLGFFAVHFYSRGIDYLTKHDQTQAQVAMVQAKAAATQVTQDASANTLLLNQLAQITQQNTITNQRIDTLMNQRAQQTLQQKRVDDNASSAELAVRIQSILGVGTIKVETQPAPLPDNLSFSLDAAHADADKLEDLGQAQADVKDVSTKLIACNTLTAKQTDAITGLNKQIVDGGVALKTEQTSHKDDVALLKSEKRKSWLNGFKWGAITGIIGGLFIHHP
jgi:hypothetical protein